MPSTARFVVYLVGLLFVLGAAWVFLTQTEWGQALPAGVGLAVLLLLVGIGIMASARSLNGTTHDHGAVHSEGGGPYLHRRETDRLDRRENEPPATRRVDQDDRRY